MLRLINSKYEIIAEFLRYCIVGGISFACDFTALFILKEYIFNTTYGFEIYISSALAFLIGLTINFILSYRFVFRNISEDKKGPFGFFVFSLIGLGGLLITEIGMFLGYDLLHIHYLIIKIIVTFIGLFWNYTGRRIFLNK